MENERSSYMTAALIAIVIIAILFLIPRASGHDHNRPDLNSWYSSLRSGRGPCCDGPGTDAAHLGADDWTVTDGHYRVRIPKDSFEFGKAMRGEQAETIWTDVPDEAVIHEPNKDGLPLVWPYYGPMTPAIRCFMPGAEG